MVNSLGELEMKQPTAAKRLRRLYVNVYPGKAIRWSTPVVSRVTFQSALLRYITSWILRKRFLRRALSSAWFDGDCLIALRWLWDIRDHDRDKSSEDCKRLFMRGCGIGWILPMQAWSRSIWRTSNIICAEITEKIAVVELPNKFMLARLRQLFIRFVAGMAW